VRRSSRHSISLGQKLFTAGLVVVFLMIAGVVGLVVFDRVREFIAASEVLPELTTEDPVEGAPEVVYEPGRLPEWTGTERVNILAMGIDQREHEQGPWRTDTMIVFTLDPVTMSAGMLSIPRDLWVPIRGYEEGRINTAHYLGELYDHPGGGPALALDTVQYNLGVPIHHYVRVNFAAFVELVDRIGGIDITVEEDIDDPLYPDEALGYDPLFIPAGQHHFDGEMALKYARTRHSVGGDFDRAKRQQQVIMAVYDRVTQLDNLPDLAVQAPALWEAMQDSVVTDLNLDEIIALALLAQEIDLENVSFGVIDEHYTQFWTTPDGQQVLIPLRDRMRELRDYIFTSEAPLPEQADPAARLEAEAASILVLNGTTTEGLAGRTAEYLQQQGLETVLAGNADRSDYPESLIIVYTSKNYTAEYLAHLLNLPQTAVVYGADPAAEYDIAVILGADLQEPEQ
jgi:LCP family protein required for cell wall assembly